MSSFAELRIIVTPTCVDRVQLLAADDDGERTGLELYQKLIDEIQSFTHRANRILQGIAVVPKDVADRQLPSAEDLGEVREDTA